MPIESASQIQQLNPSWPTGVDPISEGDDHVRLVKTSIQGSFPGMTDAWTTDQEIVCAPGTTDAAVATVGQLKNPSSGWVDADGTILGGTADFSVNKDGAGYYEITFNEAALTQYGQAFTASAVGLKGFSNGGTCNIAAIDTTTCSIQITIGFNTYQDQQFSFIRYVA